jgi:hypothetical protein
MLFPNSSLTRGPLRLLVPVLLTALVIGLSGCASEESRMTSSFLSFHFSPGSNPKLLKAEVLDDQPNRRLMGLEVEVTQMDRGTPVRRIQVYQVLYDRPSDNDEWEIADSRLISERPASP